MDRLKKVFWYQGRINRLEYLVSVFLTLPFALLISDIYQGSPPIWLILVILYPYYTQAAKRCHDRGISAFWIIWPLNFFWNFSNKGEIGENSYGEPPIVIFEKFNK